MKIKFRFLIFFSLSIKIIAAQTPEENLKKYWLYRDRLEKNFVAISSGNEQSTNIPASTINGYDLIWSDGNGTLQYYIGLLATEYKLLKIYNQDYSDTRNKLLYALKAVERLDSTAESYWRGGSPLLEDKNGFFIRDDVNNGIKGYNQNLINYTIRSNYLEYMNNIDHRHPYEQSKDNVWHYLLNLALVRKLVDDPVINKKAVDIAYKMVRYMHSTDWTREWEPCGIFESCFPGHNVIKYYNCWRIVNPITGADVQDGARVDEIGWCDASTDGFSYGFAEAGNWITSFTSNPAYDNLHYSCSPSKDGWFFTSLTLNPGLIDTYSYRSLATVAGFPSIRGTDTYQFLVERSYSDFNHPYEHFPLIYSVLHGSTPMFSQYVNQEYNRCYQLLNSAPSCGTYNFGKGSNPNNLPERPVQWSVNNRLVWPEELDIDSSLGYYSGIDYMLLHNLLWLTYVTKNEYINNSSYSYPIPVTNLGGNSNPLFVENYENIYFSNLINQGGNVILKANNSISLLPGFEAKSGSYFSAVINSSLSFSIPDDYPIFKKYTEAFECNTVITNSRVSQSLSKQEIIANTKINSTEDKNNNEQPATYDQNTTISIFPNPASSSINLQYSGDISKVLYIEIMDATGKLMIRLTTDISKYQEIKVGTFSKGVYCVRLVTSKKILSKIFIKN